MELTATLGGARVRLGIRGTTGLSVRSDLFRQPLNPTFIYAKGGIGLVISLGVSKWMAVRFDWPILISPPVMLGTLLLAGFAGVVAGFYPALRASRLDPIDALRFD